MLLIIDNYDSFTYNLYQYIGEVYDQIEVIRNDAVSIDEIEKMDLDGIILSPGPGTPENAGICIELVQKLGARVPILGICLGHQAIGHAFGGKIIGADEIKHGKTSVIQHSGGKLFRGIKDSIQVMRYHSLIVDRNSVPEKIMVTSETEDGVIMGIKHKEHEIYGLQFHPESILTEQGKDIIRNFVEGICHVARSN